MTAGSVAGLVPPISLATFPVFSSCSPSPLPSDAFTSNEFIPHQVSFWSYLRETRQPRASRPLHYQDTCDSFWTLLYLCPLGTSLRSLAPLESPAIPATAPGPSAYASGHSIPDNGSQEKPGYPRPVQDTQPPRSPGEVGSHSPLQACCFLFVC